MIQLFFVFLFLILCGYFFVFILSVVLLVAVIIILFFFFFCFLMSSSYWYIPANFKASNSSSSFFSFLFYVIFWGSGLVYHHQFSCPYLWVPPMFIQIILKGEALGCLPFAEISAAELRFQKLSRSSEIFFLLLLECFTSILTDGLSQEFEWQQHLQISRTLLSILYVLNNAVVWMVFTRSPAFKSSSLFNNPLVSGRFQQCCSLGCLRTSSYFQVLQSLYQSFCDSAKSANYNWYNRHNHAPQFFQYLS